MPHSAPTCSTPPLLPRCSFYQSRSGNFEILNLDCILHVYTYHIGWRLLLQEEKRRSEIITGFLIIISVTKETLCCSGKVSDK